MHGRIGVFLSAFLLLLLLLLPEERSTVGHVVCTSPILGVAWSRSESSLFTALAMSFLLSLLLGSAVALGVLRIHGLGYE